MLSTCMFVGDDPCTDVCLHEAIDHNTMSQHHTVMRLPSNQEGQAAIFAVCISGVDVLCSDDYILPLRTAENGFQTSN